MVGDGPPSTRATLDVAALPPPSPLLSFLPPSHPKPHPLTLLPPPPLPCRARCNVNLWHASPPGHFLDPLESQGSQKIPSPPRPFPLPRPREPRFSWPLWFKPFRVKGRVLLVLVKCTFCCLFSCVHFAEAMEMPRVRVAAGRRSLEGKLSEERFCSNVHGPAATNNPSVPIGPNMRQDKTGECARQWKSSWAASQAQQRGNSGLTTWPLGGLGLRSAVRTAPAAFWASWADALPMLSSRLPELTIRIVEGLSTHPRGCLAQLDEATKVFRRGRRGKGEGRKKFAFFLSCRKAHFFFSLSGSSRGIVVAIHGRGPLEVRVWASLRSFCANPGGFVCLLEHSQCKKDTLVGYVSRTCKLLSLSNMVLFDTPS